MLKFKVVNSFFLLLLAGNIYLIVLFSWPIFTPLLLLLFWFLITLIGATNVRLNYFFKALHLKKNHPKNEIALTFDDGPAPQTLEILNILKKYNAKATFFCIGHKIDENPEIFRRIIAEGHTVGNHSYSHAKNIGFFSSKYIQRELESCNQAAKSIAKINMKLFRMPFGICNPNIKKALRKTELQPVGWSIRSFDALFSSPDFIFKNIQKKIRPGDVILLHDTQQHTPEILERLLILLQEKSLQSVTVNHLFKISAYA
ncbi:polysaccharide deacetylase family protein [Mesonia maritima]|uniref:Peptidoglycan/xylan/chitin deacetylase (PgdA/CDA1 family) n=1 Tax=Mesonia maritima TaxID=1793873 RepID=A0ABU1KB17_9FLAO|nr:polysaccharide deacetylase family protein [Mesonia maritima]MDR6301667.1 peptidoglycan/xylan/chitin deacetylase (PgdA/CDA1 family) [Mesonia maritima]